jgi:N-acetylglutamate synthase-like GNAT family acetyltransferase
MSQLVERLRQKASPCHFREYEPSDREACLAIFHSNEPDFVKPEYLPAFEMLLDQGTSYLLVLEHEGRIVGCGALELRGEGDIATLLFGMIHRDQVGRGFGSSLLAMRLALLAPEGDTMAVSLETGAAAAAFFGSYGFELVSVGQHGKNRETEIGRLGLAIPALWLEEIGTLVEERGITIDLRDDPGIAPGEPLPEDFD